MRIEEQNVENPQTSESQTSENSPTQQEIELQNTDKKKRGRKKGKSVSIDESIDYKPTKYHEKKPLVKSSVETRAQKIARESNK